MKEQYQIVVKSETGDEVPPEFSFMAPISRHVAIELWFFLVRNLKAGLVVELHNDDGLALGWDSGKPLPERWNKEMEFWG